MAPVKVCKAHAYGNDFLLVPAEHAGPEDVTLARALCDRHTGIGADGLIFYTLRAGGASMRLLNADGSPSELSGNGLRCLGTLVALEQQVPLGTSVVVETGAGGKRLELLGIQGARCTFRAAMGPPRDLRQTEIAVLGETLTASVLSMGNPQCVVLGPLPEAARFARLGLALSTHGMFPAGTNVEFAQIDAPHQIRILIWERGVGPTTSSGTGSSAAAVAAAAHGGAARTLNVIAPGGTQYVEWLEDGVYLTGWAEIVLKGEYMGTRGLGD
jgi:diaminopimelate epimerase